MSNDGKMAAERNQIGNYVTITSSAVDTRRYLSKGRTKTTSGTYTHSKSECLLWWFFLYFDFYQKGIFLLSYKLILMNYNFRKKKFTPSYCIIFTPDVRSKMLLSIPVHIFRTASIHRNVTLNTCRKSNNTLPRSAYNHSEKVTRILTIKLQMNFI